MKIVHLSHNDIFGGATNAALRIIEGLNSIGLDNTFLVSSKVGRLPNTHVISTRGNKHYKIVKAKITQITDRLIRKLEFTEIPMDKSPNLIGAVKAKSINKYDCVHLHHVNGGLISINQIGKISTPILWTMPDMWPFLGGEHYLTYSDNKRFVNGYLESNRNKKDAGLDISRYIWKKKLENFNHLNLIAQSSWLANQANQSPLFKNNSIAIIPPPIDFEIFQPGGRDKFRNSCGIRKDEFVIGFLGGMQIRKGWNLVYELILHGSNENNWRFILGGLGQSKYPDLPVNVLTLGTIHSPQEILDFYAGIDVLLFPSIQEAFGLVAQEAQSCGVPVIVFSNTGCSDIVENSASGFVLNSRSVKDLIESLRFLEYMSGIQKINMSNYTRQRAFKLWNKSSISEKYKLKYTEIIASTQNSKNGGRYKN